MSRSGNTGNTYGIFSCSSWGSLVTCFSSGSVTVIIILRPVFGVCMIVCNENCLFGNRHGNLAPAGRGLGQPDLQDSIGQLGRDLRRVNRPFERDAEREAAKSSFETDEADRTLLFVRQFASGVRTLFAAFDFEDVVEQCDAHVLARDARRSEERRVGK